MRLRPRLLPSVVLACVLTLPASAAAAGASGLHVDPASPLTKAYALPLGSARGAGTGNGQSGGLFGSGITHGSAAGGIAYKSAAYRTPKPAPGAGLALMGLGAVVVVAIGAAGAIVLSRRR